MFFIKRLKELSSWLLSGIKLRYKAIVLVLCAILGGHLCDTHYQFSFPIFKIAFTCVGFIILSTVQQIENGEEESEQE